MFHTWFIGKLSANGLSEEAILFFYSYLKWNPMILKVFSMCPSYLSQGWVLHQILFNIFINAAIFIIAHCMLPGKMLRSIANVVKKESIETFKCFKLNHLFANPNKLETMCIKSKNIEHKYPLKVGTVR